MAILTISRQLGSLGDEIAENAARTLGYELLTKDNMHALITSCPVDFSMEFSALAEESQPGFFQRMLRQQGVYVNLLASIIYEVASRDNVIMVGRGTQYLLASRPNVIKIRVVAPFQLRVERFLEKQSIHPDIAAEMIRKNDRDRSGFIRYLFQKEVTDPEGYDVIISTGQFDMETVSAFICEQARRLDGTHPLSEMQRQQLMALSLEKRVEAVLQKEMPDSNHIKVKAGTEGQVIISGYIGTDAEKKKAGETTRAIAGVKAVVNEIHVAHFPVSSWR